MLTADICESCMKTYKEQDVENLKILQFFKALDGIRESLIFRSRTILLKKPSKIEIDLNTEKKSFYLTDLNLILPLNPKEKSLYMLFLKNEKGLKISELKNYEEELKKNYTLFAYNEDLEAQEKSIKLLTNSEKNNNNETISKINRKIKNNVGIELYYFYCIAGERGKAKHIKLNREFINIIEYKQISKR